jgi:transcriptional regulator with XRE-family HTH domain
MTLSGPARPNVLASKPPPPDQQAHGSAVTLPAAMLFSPVIEIGMSPRDEERPPAIAGAGEDEEMEQPASAPPSDGSFGALLQAFRHRAYLSQEQLAARAELSERTVRNLEAGRVRSPRNTTVRLLADALELAEPEREGWLAAARGANGRSAEPRPPEIGSPARAPGRATVVVLAGDAQDASALAVTCQIDNAGELVLLVHCAQRDSSGLLHWLLAHAQGRTTPADRRGGAPRSPGE